MNISEALAPRPDALFFKAIKESRDSFFVEYHPPIADNQFATLSLVFLSASDVGQVVSRLENELQHWLSRYPVPIMASAYDATGSLIDLSPLRSENHMVGWLLPASGEHRFSSHLCDLSAFLAEDRPPIDLTTIYGAVPHRTGVQVTSDADASAQERRLQASVLRLVLVAWVAAIPATLAAIVYLGPAWLNLTVVLFTMWKAFAAGLRLTGHLKSSKATEARTEKERKMRHYFYHCELNPQGFVRLKAENFEKDGRERTLQEATELQKEPHDRSA